MFGNRDRSVPAHMPHLINKDIMEIIEKNMTKLVNETIHHRFREGNDLQYAFLYFHYHYHLEWLKRDKQIDLVWSWIDADGDGVLNDNELDSLNVIVNDKRANFQSKDVLLDCLKGNLTENKVLYRDAKHNLKQHAFYSLNITFEDFKQCDLVRYAIELEFPFTVHFEQESDESVAFQMINDDVSNTLQQLDSVRQRKSKFVCINDNIHNKTPQLTQIIHDFYESFFPLPSQFEKNRSKIEVNGYYIEQSVRNMKMERIFHSFFNLYSIKYGIKIVIALLFVALVVFILKYLWVL